MPVSVAAYRNWVFVLNHGSATQAPCVVLFSVTDDGKLKWVDGAAQFLTLGSNPSQVAVDPTGTGLAVTMKGNNMLAGLDIREFSHLWAAPEWAIKIGAPVYTAASSTTPYGFAFTPIGLMVVSEANPSGASSYWLLNDMSFEVASAHQNDALLAACWVAALRDGTHAYVANAGSKAIGTWVIDKEGALTRAGNMGIDGLPVELTLGQRDGQLYALTRNGATQLMQIEVIVVGVDGTLESSIVGFAEGLPAGAQGVAALNFW